MSSAKSSGTDAGRGAGTSAGAEALALQRDAAKLGVQLSDTGAAQLLRLLDELQHWNRAYNLTAVTERREMITHHLLDSLSVAPLLVAAAPNGGRIADVGTGAGFPGLPLAVALPQQHFTLIDSNGKKIRFVAHAVRTLGLKNVTAVHERAEEHDVGGAERGTDGVAQPGYDCVVARAYAALPELLASVQGLCNAATIVIAMKGRLPEDEIAALPATWRLLDSKRVEVPGLAAERHLLRLVQARHPSLAGPGAAASRAGAAR